MFTKLCELCVCGVYVRDTPVHRWNLDKGWFHLWEFLYFLEVTLADFYFLKTCENASLFGFFKQQLYKKKTKQTKFH